MNLGYRDPLVLVSPAALGDFAETDGGGGLQGLNLGKFFQRAIAPALPAVATLATGGGLLNAANSLVAPKQYAPPAAPIQQQQSAPSVSPWLIGGGVVLGALVFLKK